MNKSAGTTRPTKRTQWCSTTGVSACIFKKSPCPIKTRCWMRLAFCVCVESRDLHFCSYSSFCRREGVCPPELTELHSCGVAALWSVVQLFGPVQQRWALTEFCFAALPRISVNLRVRLLGLQELECGTTGQR